jgi:hypothetical protein
MLRKGIAVISLGTAVKGKGIAVTRDALEML